MQGFNFARFDCKDGGLHPSTLAQLIGLPHEEAIDRLQRCSPREESHSESRSKDCCRTSRRRSRKWMQKRRRRSLPLSGAQIYLPQPVLQRSQSVPPPLHGEHPARPCCAFHKFREPKKGRIPTSAVVPIVYRETSVEAGLAPQHVSEAVVHIPMIRLIQSNRDNDLT